MLNLNEIDKIDRLDKVVDMLGSLDSLNHSVGVVGVMVGVAAGIRKGCKTTSIHSHRYLYSRAEANQKTGMLCSSSHGICVLCISAMETDIFDQPPSSAMVTVGTGVGGVDVLCSRYN